ncbi:MAG: hypothetical protein DRJ05_09940 [Bacteroidetes bacterium]|nr:MAG: hypothetical protein DRJ05_09940 [Bacteroidota bacterium]
MCGGHLRIINWPFNPGLPFDRLRMTFYSGRPPIQDNLQIQDAQNTYPRWKPNLAGDNLEIICEGVIKQL